MPRVSRRLKRRTESYSEQAIYHLLHGVDPLEFVGESFGNGDRFDEVASKAAWEKLRDTLLPKWVEDHPGTRPAAWWWFDAPQPARRERVDGNPHPFDNQARTLTVASSDNESFWKAAYRLWFGLPAAHIMPFDQGLKEEMLEPEWSFLVRHNLLLPEDSP